jgi:D-glucosaminate-6-phosphate ammonia-lyase
MAQLPQLNNKRQNAMTTPPNQTSLPADPRAARGLRRIVNVSGTMTALGASIVVPEAVAAVAAVLPYFVEIGDLQRKASAVIARLCKTEAGFVTASASAGLTVAVAGAMTGADLAAIERLPDARGLQNEVAIQSGHMVSYGAPVEQAIRLAGAKVVPVGQATEVRPYQLAGAIGPDTAAVMYVVSHHVVQYGQLTLEEVVEVSRPRGVPVIVDAASEYDLTGFLARGADLAVYSAHKFLGGPTAGIVAGKLDLVRAAFLQNMGIGRGMKVGKEGMLGAIAALEAWETRDHAGIRARETGYLRLWHERLSRHAGVSPEIEADPTNNPLDRLKVQVDPAAARITAWDLADALATGEHPVIVRDHEVEQGFFYLDPCNLHSGEEKIVADRLDEELTRARTSNAPTATNIADRRRRRFEAALRWPN